MKHLYSIYLFNVYRCLPACMSVSMPPERLVPVKPGERELDPLGLVLQAVRSYYMGARNQIQNL